jgi:hypothetical protein
LSAQASAQRDFADVVAPGGIAFAVAFAQRQKAIAFVLLSIGVQII